MATFITLLTFTDQGMRNVKESPSRVEAFKKMAGSLGVTVKTVYYTLGTYDLVVVTEGDEEAAMATLLRAGSLGNVRSQTLRGFSVDEFTKIIARMPA